MFAQLLPNALLLQSLIPIKGFYFSFNAVSWYLSDTMLFALVFPFIVKGLNRLGKNGKIAVLVAMLMAYSALVYLLPVENRHAILYINPLVRIVDFILGIYLYMLYKNIKWKVPSFTEKQERWSSFVNVLIFTFTVAISYVASDDTVLIAAVYWISVCILLIMSMLTGVFFGGGKIYNFVVWIGDISCPIFLTHQLVIRYVNTFCNVIGFDNASIRVAVIIPLIITATWLCDKYFVRPVSLWLQERIN